MAYCEHKSKILSFHKGTNRAEKEKIYGKFWKNLWDIAGFAGIQQDANLLNNMVRKERLELSRREALEPKSSASTNSATFARFQGPRL